MDGLSAAASVIAVAEVGAKLAFTLYQVADSYKSAAKDIQSVAKNTTLFAAVLKDLGHTLERASRNSNVRTEAYHNCLNVIEECKGVFQDIQTGLNINLGDKELNIDKLKKLRWFVAKPKVEVWQARLESLKATISVQVAVLNYGELLMPANPRRSRNGQAEWLALQAMILTEKTTQADYQKLLMSQAQASADGGPSGKPMQGMFANTAVVPGGRRRPGPGYSASKGGNFLDDDNDSLTDPWPNEVQQAKDRSPKVKIMDHSSEYLELWSELDVIEHAIRKVDLATWEAERLQDNLLVRSQQTDSRDRRDQEINKTRLKLLIKRLERRLTNAGFSDQDVDMLIEHLEDGRIFYGLGDGRRRLINLGNGKHMAPLRSVPGIDTRPDLKALDGTDTWRWMPDLLDDFLWAHTCNTLKLVPFKQPQPKLSDKDAAAAANKKPGRRPQFAKEIEAAQYIASKQREAREEEEIKKRQKEMVQREKLLFGEKQKLGQLPMPNSSSSLSSASADSDELDHRPRPAKRCMRRTRSRSRSRQRHDRHDNRPTLGAGAVSFGAGPGGDASSEESDTGSSTGSAFYDPDRHARRRAQRRRQRREEAEKAEKAEAEGQKFDPNWSEDRARELIGRYLYL